MAALPLATLAAVLPGIAVVCLLAMAGLAHAKGPLLERQPLPPLPEDYTVIDQVAALVDESIVTMYEVDRAADIQLTAMGGGEKSDELRRATLAALIDEILVLSEANELELRVSEADIDQALARIRGSSGWSDERLESEIIRLGFANLQAYREHTRKEILKQKTFLYKVGSRVNVGAVDVQRVLDEEYGGGNKERQVRVSTIVRRVRPDASEEERAEAGRMAKWIQQQADAAPELFVDLVRKYSEDDATRFDEGDLGWLKRGRLQDAELEGALFRMAIGDVSVVRETMDGFRIFQVTAKRSVEVDDLEELRDKIYQRLFLDEQERLYTKWLEELRQTHYVEYRLYAPKSDVEEDAANRPVN